MTPAQAKALAVGAQVVTTAENGSIIGEVIEKDFARIKIEWEDGLRSSYTFDNWIVTERMEVLK